jgi:hypothetical protein
VPNVPIPLVGPTYTSRSLSVASQVTRNFYIEVNNTSQDNQTIAAFQPFPGLTSFATTTGQDRGLGVYNDELYKVSGNTLYKISAAGLVTTIGAIAGSGRCTLTEDNYNLVIATGSTKPYIYDGTTLTIGTDASLHTSNTAAYIKNRVVYDGFEGDVIFADLGTPLSVDSANITSADNKPDDTIAVYPFKDQLFAFGANSITPYYNSGSGNPPYDIIQNAVQEIGLHAIHSLSSNNNAMFFLGSDKQPYALSGLQPQSIGNPAIGQAIDQYTSTEDAIGECFTFNNQNFYLLTFPQHETWLFSEGAGWTNLSYGVDHEAHLISSYAYCYGKHLVGDRRNGNLYELDFNAYTDNSETIFRQRDTAKVSGKGFGYPGKEIFMERLEIVVERGVGLITGQGSDPQIMMQYSDDNGETWSSERWASMGVQGNYGSMSPIVWDNLGSFYERMFRFRVTDPVKCVLVSASADIEVGT